MKLHHSGRGEIGKVARVRIVDADTQRVDVARLPDCLGCRVQPFGIDPGEGLLDIAQRALHHVGVQCPEAAAPAGILQPPRPIRETRRTPANRLAEGFTKILVSVEADLPCHTHEGVGFDLRRTSDLAHGRDPHVLRVFEHVARSLLCLGRQVFPFVR